MSKFLRKIPGTYVFVTQPNLFCCFFGRVSKALDIVQANIDSFEAAAISTQVSQFFETKLYLELLANVFSQNSAIT